MVAAPEKLLGIGLYTTEEAAFYARVPPQTFARWTFGNKSGAAVYSSQRAASEDRLVGFLDFIQALAVRAVRTQYPEIPLPKIREAIESARKNHNIEFPLAVKDHKIYVLGRDLLVNVGDSEPDLVHLNRGRRGQHAFVQVVEQYVRNVDFDEHGNAMRYTPLTTIEGKIVMDPKIRMGEPMVLGCGYSAASLVEAVKIEGSLQAAAKAYGVSLNDLNLAWQYIDSLPIAA